MPFKDFDIFPKMREDYSRQRTTSGILTLFCVIVMGGLFVTSFLSYITTPPKQRLRVDDSPLPMTENSVLDFANLPKIKIHFDIFLPSLPCAFVNFGVIDDFKEIHTDTHTKVKLRRFDKSGNPIPKQKSDSSDPVVCGSCYGAASGCCNTCKEVKRAFKAKGRAPPPLSTIAQCKGKELEYERIKDEKCRIYGTVTAPPTSGVFYIAPGDTYGGKSSHIEDYLAMGLTVDDFNMTHRIDSFFIGETDPGDKVLTGVTKSQNAKGRMKSLYFVRAVREKLQGEELYRTSVTHYERFREGSSGKFPGIFFHYDVSPIIVEYKRDVSFLHFLVDLMAIIGGVFSLGIFVDHMMKSDTEQKIQ